MSSIRVQAKLKDDVVTVKALIKHPMETGMRKDRSTNELIPAHFIKELTIEHNGESVMNAYWSGGVSQDPYIAFEFTGGKVGDTVKMTWKDNKDETDSKEVKIK